ncbi:MAG: nuclear transport factor 2 family protein [Thermoleophilia bacterium]
MTDPVARLIEAIDRKDAAAIPAVYAPDARFVGMTPNTFQVAEGRDAVAAKVAEWFTSWGEDPAYAFLGTVREGERAVVEFERTSTYEGAAWVTRQAHVMRVTPAGIADHRVYCCGPREGTPDLAALYAGVAS